MNKYTITLTFSGPVPDGDQARELFHLFYSALAHDNAQVLRGGGDETVDIGIQPPRQMKLSLELQAENSDHLSHAIRLIESTIAAEALVLAEQPIATFRAESSATTGAHLALVDHVGMRCAATSD